MKKLSGLLVIWTAVISFEALAGKEECMSAFNAKDFGRAFQECQGPAREGDVSSQHAMAKMYFQGGGVKQNLALAAEWTRKVAEQGDTAAQCILGSMYAEGSGVTGNQAEAVIWYRRAAEGGELSCQMEMSRLALEARNPAEAFDWRLMAAKQGYAPAQFYVGLSYLMGEAVEKNSPEGEQWLRRSAAQGYAKAREELAKLGVQESPVAGQPRQLTCEDGRSLKNTYTPLDLYSVMPDCMAKKLYQEAGDIYALAGVYGYFDRLRVRDRSAHQAVSILAMTFGAKLSGDFREYLKTVTLGEGLIQLCGRIKKIGMPDYFPHYMVSHGLGSHQAALNGEAPPQSLHDANPVEIWNHALDKYLHCPI